MEEGGQRTEEGRNPTPALPPLRSGMLRDPQMEERHLEPTGVLCEGGNSSWDAESGES